MSSQDVRFDESRIEGYRRFSNKLWNATRLVVGALGAEPLAIPAPDAELELEDRWILSRLQHCTGRVQAGIDGFSFQISMEALYGFVWNEFCDWYLEAVKPRLKDGDQAARAVCAHVLDVSFRLLHPFMPFVTEELWHRLPGERDFLTRMSWPEVDGYEDQHSEDLFALVMRTVEEIRSARKAAGAPDRGGFLELEDHRLMPYAALVATLARLELLAGLSAAATPLAEVAGKVEFPRAQTDGARQDAELARLRREVERVQAKLANAEFRTKAPAEVVAKEEQKLTELRASIERLSQ
jgi:valyl-tRNA synthetase